MQRVAIADSPGSGVESIGSGVETSETITKTQSRLITTSNSEQAKNLTKKSVPDIFKVSENAVRAVSTSRPVVWSSEEICKITWHS